MPIGQDADNYLLGDLQVDEVYAGDIKVWPRVLADTITLTYIVEDDILLNVTTGFTVSDAYSVDWGDGVVEDFNAGDSATHPPYPLGSTHTCVITARNGEPLTSFVIGDRDRPPNEAVFNSSSLKQINVKNLLEAGARLTRVEFLVPPALLACTEMFIFEDKLVEVVGDFGQGVTNFNAMFRGCRELTTVSGLNTASGTTFMEMFLGCVSLTATPDLDTSSGTIFHSMFAGCIALETVLPLDTSSGVSFYQMFTGCANLETVPVLDTSSGTDFYYLFYACSSLTNVPDFDTSSGTNFSGAFELCSSLTDAPNWNLSAAQWLGVMFNQCASLVSVPAYDLSSAADCHDMFAGCVALTSIPALNLSSSTTFDPSVMYENIFKECLVTSNLAFGAIYSIGIDGSLMDAAAIDTFFTNLGTADTASAATVNVQGCPGSAGCNPAIAEAKGWVVQGAT